MESQQRRHSGQGPIIKGNQRYQRKHRRAKTELSAYTPWSICVCTHFPCLQGPPSPTESTWQPFNTSHQWPPPPRSPQAVLIASRSRSQLHNLLLYCMHGASSHPYLRASSKAQEYKESICQSRTLARRRFHPWVGKIAWRRK